MRKFQDFTSMLPSFQSIFHQFQPKIATQGLCVQDFVTADWKEFPSFSQCHNKEFCVFSHESYL